MKKKRQNVIEINGNLYDATTGLPVKKAAHQASHATSSQHASKPAKKTHRGTSMDGFVGSPKKATHIPKSTATKKATAPKPEKSSQETPKTSTVHRQPASKVGRRAKSSVTLNRAGVKKPVVAVTPTTEEDAPSVFTTALKQADKKRLERLQSIHQSDLVSRFGHSAPKPAEPDTNANNSSSESKSLTHHLAKTHDTPAPTTSSLSKKEQFIQNTLAKTAVHESAKKAAHQATKKHRKKATKSRVGSYATAGLVALLLTGYLAYLNIPSISMKVAANRAGFAATMPGYQPAGYSLNGPIAYSPGQVTVNFSSNTDDRKFSLRQQPTTWDSNALLENYVTKQSSDYLTYQDQGLSIYIFNGTNAAWVNGQKMYVIEGDNSQLDTDQILKLATSV